MTWKPIKGALTAPVGMRWWNNGESRFSGNYRHELRPEPQPIGKGTKEYQKAINRGYSVSEADVNKLYADYKKTGKL